MLSHYESICPIEKTNRGALVVSRRNPLNCFLISILNLDTGQAIGQETPPKMKQMTGKMDVCALGYTASTKNSYQNSNNNNDDVLTSIKVLLKPFIFLQAKRNKSYKFFKLYLRGASFNLFDRDSWLCHSLSIILDKNRYIYCLNKIMF